MTEQPTTPPEPIQQSAFPTGRGVCWSAHPNIDGVVPPTQPYQPPARTRPAGWPKTGTVGASATLGSDEEPVTVPARAYDGEGMPVHEPRCDSCADSGHVCENHPDRPWAGVSDDINACDCGGAGMPCPVCCDPIPEDGSTSIGAAFTPRKFARGKVVDFSKPGFGIVSIAEARSWGIEPPPAVELLAMADDLNAHGGVDERFVAGLLNQAATDEPEPPMTYFDIVNLFAQFPRPLPLDTVKLTQAQIDSFPQRCAAPSAEPWHFFGTPVELVETVEESTPYRLANAQPGGIVEIHGELSDAEFETLRADWPLLPRWIVEADREFVAHVNDGVDKAAVLDAVRAAADEAAAKTAPYGPKAEFGVARRPAHHQHIWSTTSPMRCVECRRYLRPWWRRTLDRVRRSGR